MPKGLKTIKNAPPPKRFYNVNPALEPFLVPVDSLKPDPKNARKHPKRNLDAIMMSFREFGQQKALVYSKGVVIAGNGALEAVKGLKWTHVAAIEFNGNGNRLAGFKEADNRTGELSVWDFNQLSENLTGLKEAGVSLEWVGFSDEEFSALALGKAWEGVPTEEVQSGQASKERPLVIEVSVTDRTKFDAVLKSLQSWAAKFDHVKVEA